jgi:hypothetical protein
MYPPVVTKDATAVEAEVQSAFMTMFPQGDKRFVSQSFDWATDCFTGHFKDYQAIDAQYHDFEHTLQGTLCFTRLLKGRFLAHATPVINEKYFQLGLLAILLHDTGYLKKRGDDAGTGAKYTVTHVDRSAAVAEQVMTEKRCFLPEDIRAVKHMIRCTGINVVLSQIPFQSIEEKIIGQALGTSDLLGQMSADDYVEKLPALYAEFSEAAAFSSDQPIMVGTFSSTEDLMLKTPAFWENYVLPKLNTDFEGLYRFLNDPYPTGPNQYIQKIQANMLRLKSPLREDREPVH